MFFIAGLGLTYGPEEDPPFYYIVLPCIAAFILAFVGGATSLALWAFGEFDRGLFTPATSSDDALNTQMAALNTQIATDAASSCADTSISVCTSI